MENYPFIPLIRSTVSVHIEAFAAYHKNYKYWDLGEVSLENITAF